MTYKIPKNTEVYLFKNLHFNLIINVVATSIYEANHRLMILSIHYDQIYHDLSFIGTRKLLPREIKFGRYNWLVRHPEVENGDVFVLSAEKS